MGENKPVAGVVRPFGLIGGRYEVDSTGLWAHRAAWLVAIIVVLGSVFRDELGLTRETVGWMYGAALLAVFALTLIVTIRGRKL